MLSGTLVRRVVVSGALMCLIVRGGHAGQAAANDPLKDVDLICADLGPDAVADLMSVLDCPSGEPTRKQRQAVRALPRFRAIVRRMAGRVIFTQSMDSTAVRAIEIYRMQQAQMAIRAVVAGDLVHLDTGSQTAVSDIQLLLRVAHKQGDAQLEQGSLTAMTALVCAETLTEELLARGLIDADSARQLAESFAHLSRVDPARMIDLQLDRYRCELRAAGRAALGGDGADHSFFSENTKAHVDALGDERVFKKLLALTDSVSRSLRSARATDLLDEEIKTQLGTIASTTCVGGEAWLGLLKEKLLEGISRGEEDARRITHLIAALRTAEIHGLPADALVLYRQAARRIADMPLDIDDRAAASVAITQLVVRAAASKVHAQTRPPCQPCWGEFWTAELRNMADIAHWLASQLASGSLESESREELVAAMEGLYRHTSRVEGVAAELIRAQVLQLMVQSEVRPAADLREIAFSPTAVKHFERCLGMLMGHQCEDAIRQLTDADRILMLLAAEQWRVDTRGGTLSWAEEEPNVLHSLLEPNDVTAAVRRLASMIDVEDGGKHLFEGFKPGEHEEWWAKIQAKLAHQESLSGGAVQAD